MLPNNAPGLPVPAAPAAPARAPAAAPPQRRSRRCPRAANPRRHRLPGMRCSTGSPAPAPPPPPPLQPRRGSAQGGREPPPRQRGRRAQARGGRPRHLRTHRRAALPVNRRPGVPHTRCPGRLSAAGPPRGGDALPGRAPPAPGALGGWGPSEPPAALPPPLSARWAGVFLRRPPRGVNNPSGAAAPRSVGQPVMLRPGGCPRMCARVAVGRREGRAVGRCFRAGGGERVCPRACACGERVR